MVEQIWEIPTWDNGTWGYTEFKSNLEFYEFLVPLFKIPGQYEFDETSFLFNAQARAFDTNKAFCFHPVKSRDYIKYWDTEKEKNRRGVIFKHKGKTWYIARDYYMWLNFLPIYNKEEAKYGFAKVRDVQYHMALYEILAELDNKHSSILKKRQIASSYFHCAKMINQVWFEEGVTNKMGASHKDYINEKGSWKFLSEYRSFLDEHTAWYRPMNPGKVLMWQQKIESTTGGRKSERGLKGTIQGLTFDKNPTNGVGGPCKYFFHEEAGVAPKMDTTFEFLRPALGSGDLTTGMFIGAGSVGDLDQCGPHEASDTRILKVNQIYAVDSDLLDEKGTLGKTGLFIPEQWSMPPYIDEFGNSLVEKSLAAIDAKRVIWKRDLAPDIYQLRISQHPTNIAEAFAYRKESMFPIMQVTAQQKRIEDKTYGYEFIDLERTVEGKINPVLSNKLPIKEFPITKKTEDKTGVLVVWERPVASPTFGMYYASIDPVAEGKTTTSESLCSIYIYKNPVEVTRDSLNTANGTETFIERDKIVAAWCGRFDDLNDTHRRLESIIEWYNAWTIVENNVSLFIQYMISQKKQRYLVPKDQILFLKDIGANQNVYQEYGWKNTGTLFKTTMLSYAIEYLKESLDTETLPDGTIVKTIYGVERIPDPMLLKEMLDYEPDLNVDRLVAFAALIAFAKIQQANRGPQRRREESDKNKLQNSDNLYKLSKTPFRHMGNGGNSNSSSGDQYKIKRNPFRNIK